jgi:ABC-2 type transport system ATP-binding protein
MAIELDAVSKSFGGCVAVDQVTLTVPRGSVFGLLGHNGAGKSTTLGMLLGQVYPDRGRVQVLGHDVFSHRRAALQRVGAIFESPAFYDYLSGWRNLLILCRYSGDIDLGRIRQVVDLVGLTDRIGHTVGAYSHGMRQRLALAQALLCGTRPPELLILDEPADGLDPQGIHDLRDFLRRLHDESGMTILFSSHQLHEVELLCSHVAVLDHGKLVFCGKLAEAKLDDRLITLDVDRRDDAVAMLTHAGLIAPPHVDGKLALADRVEPADVARLLVERGHRVQAIGAAPLSLEDFYLRLVRQKDKRA